MKKYKTYKVGGKSVRYAKGTRPRADGIQIDFTDKTVTPPLRRQITWDVDPSLQQSAEGAEVKRELILAEIKAAVRDDKVTFDLGRHFKGHETRRTIEQPPAPADVLLADAVEKRLHEPHLAVGTQRMYGTIVGELRARWPALTLSEFTVDHLQSWMTDMKRAGRTIKTIENKLCFINPVLRQAVRRGELRINPIDMLDERIDFQPGQIEVTRKAVKASTGQKIDVYQITELTKIFSKMAGHSSRLEQSANLVRLYLNGPRTGEGFAVAWEDVDFEKRTIKICRCFNTDLLGARKNAKEVATYDVELDEQGFQAVMAQKKFTYNMKPYQTGTEFGALRFMFRDLETGHPLWTHDKPFRRMWDRLLQNACVRYRPPYQLRHTCATYAISSGADAEWIAQHKLGNSAEMVKTRYGKWIAEFAKQAGDTSGARVNKMFEKLLVTR